MSDNVNDVRAEAGDAARQVIAAVFFGTVQAEVALGELKAAGYRDAELSEVASVAQSATTELRRTAATTTGATFFREHETRASAFADELVALDLSTTDAEHLVDSIVRGKTVVTVDTAPLGSGAAEIIFERHSATIYRSRSVGQAFPLAPPVEEPSPDVAFETDGDAGPDVTHEGVLELREERLVVAKETAAYAQATVSKRVVTELQTVEVPVTREELVVERVPAGAESAASPIEAGERGEQIVIPLSRDVVHIDKHVVPIAEVTVGVRQVDGVEHVRETLRREELVVEDERAPES